jgi:hypothetical protein
MYLNHEKEKSPQPNLSKDPLLQKFNLVLRKKIQLCQKDIDKLLVMKNNIYKTQRIYYTLGRLY